MPKMPKQYTTIQKKYKGLIKAVGNLGKAAKAAGPLNKKTSELVQIAAAAAIRSEGSVHSHARRAVAAGQNPMRSAMRSFCSRAPSASPPSPLRCPGRMTCWKRNSARSAAQTSELMIHELVFSVTWWQLCG